MRVKCLSPFFTFFSILLMISLFLAGCSKSDQTNSKQSSGDKSSTVKITKTVRIGYQKNGPLVILKSLGTLEKRLKKKGYRVEWNEFQAGPALMEALNAGSIDFGRTGDSPPIFAQAAGTPFVYIAAGKPKFNGSAILVPENSSIKSLKDLKGKTVGFAKGSSSHYLLVKALEKAGLKYSDITPAFLQPGDGRIAFEQKKIDAWVVWDPFTAAAETGAKAKMLTNGKGLTTDRDYFLANKDFAKKHHDIIDDILKEIKASSNWANSHQEDLVKMMAPLLKIDEPSLKIAVERREYGVEELTPQLIKEQQKIADTFYDLKIIPKKIQVNELMDH